MLTDGPLTQVPGPARETGGPGERMRRLERRRRLLREELLVVAVLLLCLAATVAVLTAQWLASGPSTAPAGAPTVVQSTSNGGTT